MLLLLIIDLDGDIDLRMMDDDCGDDADELVADVVE